MDDMFEAKYSGKCDICGGQFAAGEQIAANGSVQRGDKDVRVFAHAACKDPRSRKAATWSTDIRIDPSDLADDVATFAALMGETADEETVARLVPVVVKVAEEHMNGDQRVYWTNAQEAHEGWDGEPWPTIDALATALMRGAGRIEYAEDASMLELNGWPQGLTFRGLSFRREAVVTDREGENLYATYRTLDNGSIKLTVFND
jgi:hypothetical protein